MTLDEVPIHLQYVTSDGCLVGGYAGGLLGQKAKRYQTANRFTPEEFAANRQMFLDVFRELLAGALRLQK